MLMLLAVGLLKAVPARHTQVLLHTGHERIGQRCICRCSITGGWCAVMEKMKLGAHRNYFCELSGKRSQLMSGINILINDADKHFLTLLLLFLHQPHQRHHHPSSRPTSAIP